MDDLAQFIAFVLSVILLISFFVLVNRVGIIQKGIASLQQQAAEQTRYLAAISANISTSIRLQIEGDKNAEGKHPA